MHLEVVAETFLNQEFCSLKWLWQHFFPSGVQLLYCPRVPRKVFKVKTSDYNQCRMHLSGVGVSEGGAISEAWTAPILGGGQKGSEITPLWHLAFEHEQYIDQGLFANLPNKH